MSWRGTKPAACWSADAVSAVIPVEAEQRSDAVFLATHTPLPILTRSPTAEGVGGQPISEEELLDLLRRQPVELPVVPILGPPGTGKSHLVRWLRLRLAPGPETQMVFVPKHRMSLRGVLELILEKLEGLHTNELRARVDAAVDSLRDEREARIRLRGELATLVELHGVSAGGPGMPGEERELREYLASSRALPALLLDDWFRDRILGDDMPLARLVADKLRGRGSEGNQEAVEFEGADFLVHADDIGRAGAAAQEVVGALVPDEDLRQLAARMLNEQVEQAIGRIFGWSGDDLKNLLVELRGELLGQGKQLLLLVEDFSVFQGVQGGLLDAITLIPTEQADICGMKVVMAVTTGYWERYVQDTVKSRTYTVLDLKVDERYWADFDPARFVAPYLNAVRLGGDGIEAAATSMTRPPSFCNQGCPVVAECHAAFKDVDDIGLFPFNPTALKKAIASKASQAGPFVPRDVLNRVLRPVLHRDHDAIDEERFPTPEFEADFIAGTEDAWNVEETSRLARVQDDDATNERRVRLVRFWGSGQGAGNLEGTIHRAFAVPEVEALGPQTEESLPSLPARDDETTTGAPPEATPRRDAKPDLVAAVDAWMQTGELQQRQRSELKKLVHAQLVPRLELNDGWGKPSVWTDLNDPPCFPWEAVLLGDERSPSRDVVTLRIAAETEPVRVLRGLAGMWRVGSWRAVLPNGLMLQRLADQWLDKWAAEVRRDLLESNAKAYEEESASLVSALLLGAQILGVSVSPESALPNLVEALFINPSIDASLPRELAELQLLALNGSENSASRKDLQRRLLRMASFAQGDGDPAALDVSRIEDAARQIQYPPLRVDSLPMDVQRYLAILAQKLNNVDSLLAGVKADLPVAWDIGPGEFRSAVAAIDAVLEKAATSSRLPPGIDRAQIRYDGAELTEDDWGTVQQARADMAGTDDWGPTEKIALLVGDWHAPARRIMKWGVPAFEALDRLEASLIDPESPTRPLENVRSEMDALLSSAESAIERLLAVSGDER